MTPAAFESRFAKMEKARIAIETGTHSPWVSRLLEECGHEVLVANSRELRLIYRNKRKCDKVDAQNLAFFARVDPRVLHPIQHRGVRAQQSLAALRSRDVLVEARTKLILHVRGVVKSFGSRIKGLTSRSFHAKALESVPEELQTTLKPVIECIRELSAKIKGFDKGVEKACENEYPEAQQLRQVLGVGPLTALAFVLVLEDPRRFSQSRSVGAYVGLTPRKDDSGDSVPQLRITKAGDSFLRRLLVGSAQYILGPFGPDTDLRRFGEAIAKRGGKNAKKRAVVAVARKLSVLLHSLWLSGQKYEPLRNSERENKRNAS